MTLIIFVSLSLSEIFPEPCMQGLCCPCINWKPTLQGQFISAFLLVVVFYNDFHLLKNEEDCLMRDESYLYLWIQDTFGYRLHWFKKMTGEAGSPLGFMPHQAVAQPCCFLCCSLKTIAMDRTADGLLPLAACMALSDTMRSSLQGSSFEVGSRLILSNPVFEVHCVFSNRAFSSFSGSH